MDPQPSLTRVPVVVQAVDWVSKVVRTGGISGPLHDEWELHIALSCEATQVRRVRFVDDRFGRSYGRDWARERGHQVGARLRIWPVDWAESNRVTVQFGPGVVGTVESEALKTDPVSTLAAPLSVGDEVETGVPITVLTMRGLLVGLLLLCEEDTRSRQSRWRVRTPLAGSLGQFNFLAAHGRRSGWVHLAQ